MKLAYRIGRSKYVAMKSLKVTMPQNGYLDHELYHFINFDATAPSIGEFKNKRVKYLG